MIPVIHSYLATAGVWSMQHRASAFGFTRQKQCLWNPWVILFCWILSIGAQRLIRMALIIFFHLNCYFFSSLNLEAAASEKEREKGGKGCMRKGERLICMSAPLARQRGRPAERPRGWGERSSSAFQRFADLLPPVSAQEPVEQAAHTFLPLIAADETLMCLCLPSTWHMHTPQIQATAMCCGQLQHARPRQGLDQTQTDPDPAQFWHDNGLCFRRALTWSLFLFSLSPVIRAKLVGMEEVEVGNDIYGNPIKRIKYDIKQIKVGGTKLSLNGFCILGDTVMWRAVGGGAWSGCTSYHEKHWRRDESSSQIMWLHVNTQKYSHN